MRIRATAAFTSVLLGLAMTASFAARGGNRPQKPARPMRIGLFNGQVYAAEPNIEAALMLTDDQKAKIKAAADETINAPALVELRKKAFNKNTPEADRTAARAQLRDQEAKARADFRTRVDALLTPEQKALITKVNDTFAATEKEVRQQFQEKLKTDFAAKLGGTLTPEQKDAIAKAKPQQ